MSDMVLVGGTVVTAEASFRADVAVEDERIAAVGVDLPTDGAEVVDVSGALLMPGFIDGHTHLDMPFGGTVTSDDWDTGTAAAVAGGTTTTVDFSLQDIDGTLAEAVETWQGKAEGKARIDYGLHVAITNLTDAVKAEIPSLPALGVSTIKIFMAYKGTPLYTADEDLFEAMQIAREAGVLVLVHAENGDVIAKLQARGARARRHRSALARAHAPRAGRGRGDQPRDPPGRDRRHAAARRPRLVRRRPRGGPPRARPREHDLRRDLPAVLRLRVRGPRAPGLRGRQVRLLAADARPVQPPGAVARAAGRRPADLRLGPLLVQLARQKELGRDDFTLIPNGLPGLEERPAVLWTEGVRGGHISEQLFVAVLSTNQARDPRHGGAQGGDRPGQRRRHRRLGSRHDDHRHAVQPPQPPGPHALRGQDADRRAERGLHPRRAGLPRRRGRGRARAAGASSSAPSAARRPPPPCARGRAGARRRRSRRSRPTGTPVRRRA